MAPSDHRSLHRNFVKALVESAEKEKVVVAKSYAAVCLHRHVSCAVPVDAVLVDDQDVVSWIDHRDEIIAEGVFKGLDTHQLKDAARHYSTIKDYWQEAKVLLQIVEYKRDKIGDSERGRILNRLLSEHISLIENQVSKVQAQIFHWQVLESYKTLPNLGTYSSSNKVVAESNRLAIELGDMAAVDKSELYFLSDSMTTKAMEKKGGRGGLRL